MALGALACSADLVIYETEKGLAGDVLRTSKSIKPLRACISGTNVPPTDLYPRHLLTRGYLQLATFAMFRYSFIIGLIHYQ